MKLSQYPMNADNTPMDMEVGVLTDVSGNAGARTLVPARPDGAPIDAKGLVLIDKNGNFVFNQFGQSFAGAVDIVEAYEKLALPAVVGNTVNVNSRAALAALSSAGGAAYLNEGNRKGTFIWDGADHTADVASDPQQGIFVAPASDVTGASGAWVRSFDKVVNAMWFGIPNAVDDTAILQAIITKYRDVYLPNAGNYIVSRISVPANTRIRTDGFNTHVIQKSGTGAAIEIFEIAGSNVHIDDIFLEGRYGQVGDTTGEWNHGIMISADATTVDHIAGVSIGNVLAKNIRGDAIALNTDVNTRSVSGISFGNILVDNVYRHGWSMVGNIHGVSGGYVMLASGAVYGCGVMEFDIESDTGTGPVRDVDVLGVIEGRYVQIAGTTAADYADNIRVAHLDLNPANHPGSNPAYAWAPVAAILLRNSSFFDVCKARVIGFNVPALLNEWNAGELATQSVHFTELETSDCARTSNGTYAHVWGQPGVTQLSIDSLKQTIAITGTNPNRAGIIQCDNTTINACEISNAVNCQFLRSSANCEVNNMRHTGAGIPFMGTPWLHGSGGVVSATAANLCAFTNPGPVTLENYDVTATSMLNTVTKCILINSRVNGTFFRIWSNSETYTIDDAGNGTFAGTLAASNLSGTNTGNQTITLTGAVTGSGTGSFATALTASSVVAAVAGQALAPASVAATGNLSSSAGSIGYTTGAGGTVAQLTSKTTAVTLNKVCGQFTTNNAALAAGATATFQVNNSNIAATDTVIPNLQGGQATVGTYRYWIEKVAAGSFQVTIENRSGGSLSEALTFNFAAIKAVNA